MGLLVLVVYIQRYEPREFNLSSYLVTQLHEDFLNLKENTRKYFKHYSLSMHIILFYGRFRGLWLEGFNVNTIGKDGRDQPV